MNYYKLIKDIKGNIIYISVANTTEDNFAISMFDPGSSPIAWIKVFKVNTYSDIIKFGTFICEYTHANRAIKWNDNQSLPYSRADVRRMLLNIVSKVEKS